MAPKSPNNSENSNKIRAFYQIEDEIARSIGHDALKESFMAESSKLKRMLEEIVTGERADTIDSSVLPILAHMRRTARLSHYLTAQRKQETMKFLEQTEMKYLELQNSYSEIYHLQKEIKKCLDFSAGDEHLDLVSEEEFYEKAPKLITDLENIKEDSHLRYLARLKYELYQRKEFVGVLNDKETLQHVLLSDIEGKEQRLRELKPRIAALLESARDLNKEFTYSE